MKELIAENAKKYADEKADKGNYDYAVGDSVLFCKSALEHAYIDGANFGLAQGIKAKTNITKIQDAPLAGKDIDTTELKELFEACKFAMAMSEKVEKQLRAQIEKLLDWISENGNCCDFCPMTDTCKNDEGTCPYASELQKDETKTTKEWARQKLLKG